MRACLHTRTSMCVIYMYVYICLLKWKAGQPPLNCTLYRKYQRVVFTSCDYVACKHVSLSTQSRASSTPAVSYTRAQCRVLLIRAIVHQPTAAMNGLFSLCVVNKAIHVI